MSYLKGQADSSNGAAISATYHPQIPPIHLTLVNIQALVEEEEDPEKFGANHSRGEKTVYHSTYQSKPLWSLTDRLKHLLHEIPSCTAESWWQEQQQEQQLAHINSNNDSAARRSPWWSPLWIPKWAEPTSSTTTKTPRLWSTETNMDIAQSHFENVTKYIRLSDRYAAIVSLLLKRQAFCYATESMELNGVSLIIRTKRAVSRTAPFPLVQLNQTLYKKPYIPRPAHCPPPEQNYSRYAPLNCAPGGGQDDEDDASALLASRTECSFYPLSISHQFPFVGMAQMSSSQQSSPPYYSLGFDIVTFDDINRRLYSSVHEFVQVFFHQMTPMEQARFSLAPSDESESSSVTDDCLLREFYLLWAMKEAYTKALGVGLGFDFASFGISMQLVSSQDNADVAALDSSREMRSDTSLWKELLALHDQKRQQAVRSASASECTTIHQDTVVYGRGTIDFMNRMEKEVWMFAFVMLWDDEKSHNCYTANDSRGCACVCWGPLSSSTTRSSPTAGLLSPNKEQGLNHGTFCPLHVTWRTYDELLSSPSLGTSSP